MVLRRRQDFFLDQPAHRCFADIQNSGCFFHRDLAALGTFAGDTSGDCGSGTWECTTNSANAPWGWDDQDDGPGRGATVRVQLPISGV